MLGVVLFHFGASWLPGGYIGVDVFFVISGYLISKSLYVEVDSGTFSLADFYVRRARRIVPAFVAVTLATSIAAAFILFPGQLSAYATSVIWSSLFAANIYFYLSSDYFAAAAEELPLLHYWSLGIEEQFYLLFPALILLITTFARRARPLLLMTLLAISLAACEIALRHDPQAAFYLLPFRAFELLTGAVLALPGLRAPAGRALADGSALAGGALILCGMALVTERAPFPGLLALVPCVGAALVLWGGEQGRGLAARALGSAPLRIFGLISYSLYLVHWPIAVFTRMVWPNMSPMLFLIGGVTASLALGWLCWRFVEQPPRRRNGPLHARGAILAFTASATVLFVGAAAVVRTADGFPERLTAEVQRIQSYRQYAYQSVFREGECFLRPEQTVAELGADCLRHGKRSVVLWGSSHLAHFYKGLAPALAQRGYELGQITGSACRPLVGRDIPRRPNCRALNEFALDWLLANKPSIVVMGGDPIGDASNLAIFDASAQKLANAGIRVVVLGPVPYYKRPVPTILAERLGKENHQTYAGDEILPLIRDDDATMAAYYARHPNVRYISFSNSFCPPAGDCPLEIDGQPLHFDVVHFTEHGSVHYGRLLAKMILADR